MSDNADRPMINNTSTRREMMTTVAAAIGSLAAAPAVFASSQREVTAALNAHPSPSEKGVGMHARASVTLGSPNPAASIVFDLQRLKMTDKQRATAYKLFSQNPVASISEGEHVSHEEGPASKYLSKEEFASVRELGVRLGTSGVVAATACDFCLHCVKLEPKAEFGEAVE
jgi:hypothetical protein